MDDSLPQLENLYRETAPALLAYFRAQSALAGVAEDLLQDTSSGSRWIWPQPQMEIHPGPPGATPERSEASGSHPAQGDTETVFSRTWSDDMMKRLTD